MTDAMSVSSQERSEHQRPGLHRLAVVAAAGGLLAVLSGAIVTSSVVTNGGEPGFERLHEIVASLASVVIAVLAIWMIAKQPARLGWALLVVLLAEGGLGSFQQAPFSRLRLWESCTPCWARLFLP
jgi:hypothetical protein